MIVGNYTLYIKSYFYEIENVISNFLDYPPSAKCDFWNGLNKERYRLFQSNYHKRNNSFAQISCADFCKYISSIIKIHSREKEPFNKVFLTLLTHQHHLVEYYLTITKIALEIFEVITCTLGETYNVNVRHTE